MIISTNLEEFPFSEIAERSNSIEELILNVVIEASKSSGLDKLFQSMDDLFKDIGYHSQRGKHGLEFERDFNKMIAQILSPFVGNFGIEYVSHEYLSGVYINTADNHYAVNSAELTYLKDTKYISKFPKSCPHCKISPVATNMRGVMGRPERAWYWPFKKRAKHAIQCNSCYRVIEYEWSRILDISGYEHLNYNDQCIVVARTI